jgi:hypothetical protein
MRAQILTADEIRNSDGRNYNPQVWESNIKRMLDKYSNVIFYKVDKDTYYTYDRYFVEYTLYDGLRLFTKFSYSSSMTNGGFFRLDKSPVTKDGFTYNDMDEIKKHSDIHRIFNELMNPSVFDIEYGKFQELSTGEEVMINTTKEAREWMTSRSIEYGITFTKG